MCMITAAAPAFETTCRISAPSPVMSLTIRAPRRKHSAATLGLYVSIESGTLTLLTSSAMTGATRSSSSSSGVGSEPGRLLSPPMSSRSAPCSTSSSAWPDRVVEPQKAAAVRKRIGRHVDDAHDVGSPGREAPATDVRHRSAIVSQRSQRVGERSVRPRVLPQSVVEVLCHLAQPLDNFGLLRGHVHTLRRDPPAGCRGRRAERRARPSSIARRTGVYEELPLAAPYRLEGRVVDLGGPSSAR